MDTSNAFDAAYETWRRDNDTRATAERPAFNQLATTVEMPAFTTTANEKE